MTRRSISRTAVCSIALAIVLLAWPGNAGAQTIQALVLSDLGDPSGAVAKMQAFGWEATTIRTLELEVATEDTLASYDVIWTPADANYPALRVLAAPGGPLWKFTMLGGVVVIVDLDPEGLWLDVAPGGADADAVGAGGAGPITITASDHPIISGIGTGGVPLVADDLDPEGTGGRATLLDPTPGGVTAVDADTITTVVIAKNTSGPVLIEHGYGSGQVIISSLLNPRDVCIDSLLAYVQASVNSL